MNRNTIQCTLVLETVNKLPGHVTADEIYEAIAKEHPTISRATVYRNLNRLSQTGKIRRIEIPGGADRFERWCHPHYHIKCEVCGRIFDVDMEFVTGLEKGIKNTQGFEFSGYDILFYGTCPDCRKEQAEAHMK